MQLLAFDTSTSMLSIAVQKDDEVVHFHQPAAKQHTSLILPIISRLLSELGLALSDLDAIAYGAGPGSYTGIRIANSVAQGLAFGAHLPLIPISSLAAVAQTAWLDTASDAVAVAIDARVQQLYAGFYLLENGVMTAFQPDQLFNPQAFKLPQHWPTAYLAVGDAWEIYQLLLTNLPAVPTICPDARAILTLANQKLVQGQLCSPEAANPYYLR